MFGVAPRSRVTSDQLLRRMNVRSVFEVVKYNILRWFGYVERKSDDIG